VNFLESQGVFEGDGHLHGDLLHKLNVRRCEGFGIAAGKIDGAESTPVSGQRHATDRLHPLAAKKPQHVEMIPIQVLAAGDEHLALEKHCPEGEPSSGTVISALDRV